jgi:hypothetical protein
VLNSEIERINQLFSEEELEKHCAEIEAKIDFKQRNTKNPITPIVPQRKSILGKGNGQNRVNKGGFLL